MIFSPEVLPIEGEKAVWFVAHLWEHLPCQGSGRHGNVPNCSLFTLPFPSASLDLCVYTESHICSGKSGSQVDDYPILIYKEPSAFPTVNCSRSQVMRVMDLGSTIKKQLRKQMRRQAVQLLPTEPWMLTDPTSAFLPAQSQHISLAGTSLTQPSPSQATKGRWPAYLKSQPLLSLPTPPTLDCRWAEQTLEHPVTLMLQVRNRNPHQAAPSPPAPWERTTSSPLYHPVFRCSGICPWLC